MCSAVIKELRFANSQESCFEAWKRSHMGCSALLCGRFYDSQESHFQASKRSNMGSAVLKVGRSADFPNYVLKQENFQIWTVSKCKGVYLLIVRIAFSGSKHSDKISTILKRDDLLMLRNSVLTVRNVEIWAVQSRIEVDLLMLKNRVFRQRKYAVQS